MPSPTNTPADASTKNDAQTPRRFVPEPIETTTRSSKSDRQQSPEKESASKIRRFAPEPIETTTMSSRKDATSQDGKPAARRLDPQLSETSHKSNKDKSLEKLGSGQVKYRPQLVETSYGGNREPSRHSSRHARSASNVAPEDPALRKFIPEVLSTAKRSRRGGNLNPANYRDYKTEEGFLVHAREHQRHAGWKTPKESLEVPGAGKHGHAVSPRGHECPSELKRAVSPLDGSTPTRPSVLNPNRSHSFRCPALDTIESSESERESGPSSMSTSGRGSPITASDSSFNDFYKHATRVRESVDENFSHYLLQLEAKKAQQRMEEQALAAFPNSDFHEPVRHYVNDDQDSVDDEIEDRPVTWEGFDDEEFMVRIVRRESTKNVPWEQLEMQRHAEQMEQERNANKTTAAKQETHSPWWNPAAALQVEQPDSEMRSMRDRARPPMLGNDLKFPRCPSPEPARFDVTQGSATLRQQMCYLSEQSPDEKPKDEERGLWNATAKVDASMSSADSKCAAKSTTGKGLWGGFCVGKDEDSKGGGGLWAPPAGPTGLMTPAPRVENANPFEQSFAAGSGGGLATLKTPPTPPSESLNKADLGQLDAVLACEREIDEMIEREFGDSFVTQLYNYLSLGYPSLARPFDEELSKISRIPVSDLRQDDVKAKQAPRGYIRLGQDFEGGGGEGMTKDSCMRWQALKLYIREWARQEKNMVRVDSPGGNWATSNRRGSWAI